MTAATLTIDDQALFQGARLGACIGAVALVSLIAFEAMAVATAMPAIAAALDGLALVALAFGGMAATSVLGMVVSGRLCDRQGPRRATVIGLLVFGAGLLLAGLAGSMGWVVAGRVVQGLGAGMLGVALYVGMGQLVPKPLHPRLFALLAAAWVLPAMLGPLAAAWLVGAWGWRAVFLAAAAVVPVAAALLLPALARVALPVPAPDPRGLGRAGRLPLPGGPIAWAALAAAGALLLHGAAAATGVGHAAPAPPPAAWAALAVGLLGAGLAARRLLPPGSLAAAPGLPAVIALRGLLAAAFASAEVFVPLLLTREHGWSLAEAGLTLSAGAVLWSLGSAVQARVQAPHRRRRALQAGFAMVAAGMAVVGVQLLAGLPAWLVAPAWALAGFGIGLAFPMLSVQTLALSAPGEQGRNASALQLCDALACSVALAFAGALFKLAGADGGLAYLPVFVLALVLAGTGALLGRRAFA